MRTNRARLIEWVEDIQRNMGETDFWTVTAEEWADRIMEDINRGIIAPETKTGTFDPHYDPSEPEQ